jgi:acid phosphatase (class A)
VVRLKDILTLDKLVYSKKIEPKHQRSIDSISPMFIDFNIKNFMTSPPPKNSSNQTFEEILQLEKLEFDIDVDAADKTKEYFKKRVESFGLNYPKETIDVLVDDSRGIIHILKYYYNRPRPKQVAKALGLKFHSKPLKSTNTPSYPSGHSTQGRLIARYLSHVYPGYEREMMETGDEVSNSRLAAKVHYQTDADIGLELGDELYKHYKNNIR